MGYKKLGPDKNPFRITKKPFPLADSVLGYTLSQYSKKILFIATIDVFMLNLLIIIWIILEY
jgi:hypothetical protein